MKKILLFISVLIVSIFTLNIRLFASNSYYLMSCATDEIPAGYYNNVDTSSEAAIRQSLCSIISTGYVGGTYDKAWTIDSYADADPYNNGKVLCLYTGQSIDATNHGSYAGQWTREHVWCKSHGFNINKTDNYPYNDCHHLRAAEMAINNHRSNSDFGEVDGLENVQSDDYGNKWTTTIFEPRDEVKGDIARMLFYMMVRYGEYCPDYTYTTTSNNETTTHTVTYDLQLVNEDTTVASEGHGRLGNLATLLKWHYQDPVSDTEIYRNNVVYQFQSNRNPFIDHPEYVDIAFENSIGSYTTPAGKTPVEPDTVNRVEELAQTVGFEAAEGFIADTTYNGHKELGGEGNTWGIFYGTVATSGALSGSQSIQMRWYTANPRLNPQCFMMYDVNNLSKVTFSAKGIANSKIEVMYSIDQGKSWVTNEVISITASKQQYTSIISENGGYGDLRIGFKVIMPDTLPTSTTSFYIDDVSLYRGKDDDSIEFTKVATKANLNFKYDENTVQRTQTYFELITDASQLQIGDELTIATTYNDKVYALGAQSTNNFKTVSGRIKDNDLYAEEATTFILEAGSTDGTYAFKYGTKYLGNGETKTDKNYNYLKSYDTKSDRTSFDISIEAGVATMTITSSQVLNTDGTVSKAAYSIRLNGSGEGLFATYRSGQQPVSLYRKVTETKDVTEYAYNDTYLRFAGIITNELYQTLLTQDSNATFGIALSKDGTNYLNHACTVTLANLVEGKLVDNVNGDYAYFAVKVLTPKEHFNDTVYAKAYVIINGETFYMQESSHSVTELVNYYLNNVTLTDDEQDLLGGLIQ